MDDTTLESLTHLLWPDGDHPRGEQVYWLLDGARDPAIVDLLRGGGLEYTCLFAGQLHPRLQAAAPYLVHLAAGTPTTNRLLRHGWGKAWGILIVAQAEQTLTQQRLHWKKFLRVHTEDGRELAFRFYDPRVLNRYLPTCTQEEFQVFLGRMTRVLAEVPGGSAIRAYARDGGLMRVSEHPIS
jgi:hypothetical protein